MRSIRGLAAVMLSLALVACAGPSDDESSSPKITSTTSGSDGKSAAGIPTVTRANGKPVLAFPKSKPPTEVKATVLEEGKGATISASDTIVADYVGQVWGKSEPFDSSFAKGVSLHMPLDKLVPGWSKGLVGRHVGDKLILSIPPKDGYGESGQPDAGINGDDTIVFYIEIRDAISTSQAGQEDATPENLANLPVTITGKIGKPVTAVKVNPGTPEPTETSVTVIARGTGPQVENTGTMYVAYTATSMDGSFKESTWGQRGKGTQASPLGQGYVFDKLVGVPVGSRVLLVLAKTEGQNGRPASPAMFVVVDIVAYFKTG